jgi:RNA polymerase sigma factor (sigma-70 family)
VRRIQDDVYRLSIKMLWHPEDARDATQEILIRVVTRLDRFRGESAFRTWVYRVATNYLLDTRKRCAEEKTLSFAEFAEDLYTGLSDERWPGTSEAEQALFVEEVKIGCTQGMLLCLDRPQRAAYILSEILGLTGEQGAWILDVSPAAFRQRVSRARASIRDFMRGHCGLVNPSNACRCSKRVKPAIELGRVQPNKLLFATHPLRAADRAALSERVRELEDLDEAVARLQRGPDFAAPEALLAGLKALLKT